MKEVFFSRREFIQTGTGLATIAALSSSTGGGWAFAFEPEDPRKSVQLFNGKNLEGWHKNPQRIGHGTGGVWVAEEGAITGEQDPPGSGNGGILLTDKEYDNFELSIDLKPDWGICSGLFLRGNDKGQCFQMMVDYHDRGNVGHIYGEGTGGFNTRAFDIDGVYEGTKLLKLKTTEAKKAEEVGLEYSCTPEEWLKSWKVNDWNTARVIVEGGDFPRITTFLNGVKIGVFDGAKSTVKGYDKEKVLQTLSGKGRIAVQVHGGKGWPTGAKCRWKNISVKA